MLAQTPMLLYLPMHPYRCRSLLWSMASNAATAPNPGKVAASHVPHHASRFPTHLFADASTTKTQWNYPLQVAAMLAANAGAGIEVSPLPDPATRSAMPHPATRFCLSFQYCLERVQWKVRVSNFGTYGWPMHLFVVCLQGGRVAIYRPLLPEGGV